MATNKVTRNSIKSNKVFSIGYCHAQNLLRILVACFCFLFAWGCWENWAAVRELVQEQEEDGDKW